MPRTEVGAKHQWTASNGAIIRRVGRDEQSCQSGVVAGAVVLALAGTAAARDLTVVSWGGAYQDAQREVYFKPFMDQTKTKMLEENWDGGVGVLRAKVQGGNNNWDVVQVESEELLLGCEEGLYEKIDWAKLGGKDKFLPDAVHDCGVGAIVYNFVLGLRRATRSRRRAEDLGRFLERPEIPRQARAAQRARRPTLEIALMADGVPFEGRLQDARRPMPASSAPSRSSTSSSPT